MCTTACSEMHTYQVGCELHVRAIQPRQLRTEATTEADVEGLVEASKDKDQLGQMMLADARNEIARLRGQRDRVLVKVGPNGRMPTRSHHGDAGYDLHVAEHTTVKAHQFAGVASHVSIQMPPNLWGLIIGRSSTLRTHGLMVTQGVIDQGWRGDLFAGCWNLNDYDVEIRAGDRIAQLLLMPLIAPTVVLELSTTLDRGDRGTNGFGSTGQ